MVTRILTASAGSGPILDYNEKKVADGNASVVDVANMPGDDMATIYDTFEQYESNPSIATQVRKKSFHMTLGPGPTEKLSQDECISLIRDIMEQMGYGEQPYVIYKHFDIDREHYHVVSTRIDKNGRMINSHHEGHKIHAVTKSLEEKYHFKVGVDTEAIKNSDLPVVQTKEFSSKDPNYLVSLKTLFEDALKYDYHSFYQFQCVMAAMNVKVTLRKRKDGGENVILQGLDGNGKRNTRLYSMEKHLNYPGAAEYNRRLEENNAMGVLKLDRKVAIAAISDFCAENTGSALDYCSALEEAGIRHIVTRDGKSDDIKRVTLVEKSTYTLIDTGTRGELYLNTFKEAEKNGRWAAPPPKSKRPAPGAKVRKKGGAAFFTPERTEKMRQFVSAAVERYRNPSGIRVGVPGGRSMALPGRKISK